MNDTLFFTINHLAGHSIWLDYSMIVITKYGPGLFMLYLLWYYIKGWMTKQASLRAAMISIGLYTSFCLLLSGCIGLLWFEPRPFITHSVHLLLPLAANASFPSNHAMGTMAIAMGFLFLKPRVGQLLFLGSLLIGFSRVFVGHHYPFDVLGGFMLVWITFFLYHRYIDATIQKIYLTLEQHCLLLFNKINLSKKNQESL